MRLAARVLLPGTGWIAFAQLNDLVVLMMELLGRDFCQEDPWPCWTSIPIGQFEKQPSHLEYKGRPSLID